MMADVWAWSCWTHASIRAAVTRSTGRRQLHLAGMPGRGNMLYRGEDGLHEGCAPVSPRSPS